MKYLRLVDEHGVATPWMGVDDCRILLTSLRFF